MKKAIIYTRVSTDKQEHSPEAQREKIELYCQLKEYKVFKVINEPGKSGKSITNRPGLQQALRWLKWGKADVLVVAKLDRLTRSVQDLCALLPMSERQGWTFASVAEAFDTNTPMGRFVVSLFVLMGQWERETISERTSEIVAHLKAKGRRWCNNSPYGSRWLDTPDGKVLVPDDVERNILLTLHKWRSEGLSLSEIADRANTAGYLTRTETPWTKQTVSKRVRQEVV